MIAKLANRLMAGSALLFGPGLVAAPAWAQQTPASSPDATQIEDVVVTARFRSESAQRIGASITALSGAAIAREGLQDFEDVARRTGVNVTDRGPNQNDLAIRGVSNGVSPRLSDLGGAGPLISQFLDDIPVAAATASQRDFNYFDFDRIEVLRGPQPTLFGEGSVGGTIRYFSRDPLLDAAGVSDGLFRTTVSTTEGGGVNYSASAAASLGLIPDRLAVRAVVNYRNDDGFIDNPTLGREDINDYEASSWRVVALFQPNPAFTARLSAFSGRDRFGGDNQVDAPPAGLRALRLSTPVAAANRDDFDLYALRLGYDAGPFAVTSITGLYKRERHDEFFDAQSAAGFGLFTTRLTALGQSDTEDRSFTQELRVVSNFEGPLNLTAGLYYQDAEFRSELLTTAAEFAPFTVPTGGTTLIEQAGTTASEQLSGFLELTFAASDRLRLIAGARYVEEEIISASLVSRAAFGGGPSGLQPPFVIADVNAIAGAAGLPLDATFKLSKTLPRVSVEWDAADRVMLYATAATGARNGNLNPFSSALRGAGTPPNAAAFAAARAFQDDGVVSYEAGLKSQWLDRAVTFNLAGYYTRFDDPQIVTSNPFVLTVNGPDEDLYGIEVQSAWRATEHLSLYWNAGWQHAEFVEGARLANPAVLTPLGVAQDLRPGSRPVNTPEWQMAIGADVRRPSGWSGIELVGAASYQYVGSRYSTVQNFPSSALGEQQFVNLRLGLEGPAWALIAFVDNATNEIEYQAVQGNAGTPYLNTAGGLDFRPSSVAVNRPRQVGIELRLHY